MAAIRETTHAIQVTSTVPGEAKVQNLYCSELTGLLMPLQMIYDICNEFDIKYGSCVVVCNGKAALNKIFSISVQ